MRWFVWSKKIPGMVYYSFLLWKKIYMYINFLRFNCLLSSGLGAVKSLPDFNVKASSIV